MLPENKGAPDRGSCLLILAVDAIQTMQSSMTEEASVEGPVSCCQKHGLHLPALEGGEEHMSATNARQVDYPACRVRLPTPPISPASSSDVLHSPAQTGTSLKRQSLMPSHRGSAPPLSSSVRHVLLCLSLCAHSTSPASPCITPLPSLSLRPWSLSQSIFRALLS